MGVRSSDAEGEGKKKFVPSCDGPAFEGETEEEIRNRIAKEKHDWEVVR